MAGKTIIEKILSAHAGRDVSAGDVVWIGIDVRTARDFGGASVVKNLKENYEIRKKEVELILDRNEKAREKLRLKLAWKQLTNVQNIQLENELLYSEPTINL